MDKLLVLGISLLVCFCKHETSSLNLPGPMVYVVTPSPRPSRVGDARASPFYYHNWMRRMDSPQNSTTTTTTTTTTITPDLIFAEFESGNKMKSIRKLLEREKITPKPIITTSTTAIPIFVPDASNDLTYMTAVKTEKTVKADPKPVDMTNYFALYNNLYNPNSETQAPVYMPSTTSSTAKTTTFITTTPSTGQGVENIWHIIDSQKHEQYSGQWEEEPIENEAATTNAPKQTEDDTKPEDVQQEIDDNFALPGFATNPGNGAENESRAIRTEPNMRFPYINLKPFQMKTQKKPLINSFFNNKKGSNQFTSLDNFQDLKNPVRGEAQDVVSMGQPIDRYNPAQPYLPDYGTKSKQSGPVSPPKKTVANLVPPPPPPPPKISDGNFPAPSSYESFPPYAPRDSPVTSAPPPPPAPTPSTSYQPPLDSSDDSAPDSSPSSYDSPPLDLGYRYKPPTAPKQPVIPTFPPPPDPSGYSYDKPTSKPFTGYSYDKPPITDYSPPVSSDDKPSFTGYHYSKPEAPPSPPHDHPPTSYGHDGPSYGHDYPELIYDKPHDMKGTDDMKTAMDPPSDDHGFPHDFPDDLKFHHDFDDHDHDSYHYHHHPKATTTTTEMPRVNRYSYYYLGKKLYYLPLYFSVYFIVYVGALIIKAVLRHKIVYPNSWRPNDQTASFFSKRSVDSWDLSNENLHEITGRVTHAIAVAGEKYYAQKNKK